MKIKSIKINMVLNAIKGLMGVIFPLITFPYIIRVLGIDNVGMYTFSDSYVSYFVLLAGLGIGTYAIREGARVRGDQNKIKQLSSELFTINIISMIISYILLIASVLFVHKLENYKAIIFILSLQVIFKTVGIEWIYSIYEDYAYITIRSVLFQILSIVLMFIFVKKPSDTVIYMWIIVFASGLSNCINFLYARKYCKLGLTKSIDFKKHIKPILILFAMTATVTLYVNSDIIILGLMRGDNIVGIYTVSTKIYTVVKTILSSVLIVSIPRLSSLLGSEKRNEFEVVANDVYKTLIAVIFPSMIGIMLLRKEIVYIVGDEDCLRATSSLVLLSIAIIFCMCAWFWGQCVLIPMKQDGKIFTITIISAIINIVLNLILIPFWEENAAAFTTIIAEAFSFLGTWLIGRRYVKTTKLGIYILKVAIGCLVEIIIIISLKQIGLHFVPFVISSIILSVVAYLIVELLLKNEVLMPLLKKITRNK